MSKIDKLIKKLLSNPKDFTLEELIVILNYFGFYEIKTGKTSGSCCKFCNENKKIINFYKPHPTNIIKPYVIKQIIAKLKQEKIL